MPDLTLTMRGLIKKNWEFGKDVLISDFEKHMMV
jgi:hypothetical protein